MVHVDEILAISTPAQRRVPLNLHRRRHVKYVECRTTFEVDDLQTPARILLPIVVPEGNQLSVGRNGCPDGNAFRNLFRRAAVDRHTPQTKRIVWTSMLEQDPFTVWGKRRPRALSRFERELLRSAAVAIDSPELKNTGAVGVKDNVTIIRRHNRRIISTARGSQRPLIATGCRDLKDVSDAARVRCVENLVVGRDTHIIVAARARSDRRWL